MRSRPARLRWLASALFCAWLLAGSAHGGSPSVIASIRPVHSLVAGVMAGVGRPGLLVRGAASPHDYAMRPTDARMLHQADVVVWVGEGLEGFLRRSLDGLDRRVEVVSLLELPGLVLRHARAGGNWGQIDAAGAHAHGSIDPHLWLDPANATTIVRALAAVLARRDPSNAGLYKANGARLEARLGDLDRELAGHLESVAHVPYLVYHDAYQYFERRYQLRAVGALTAHADLAPGARRVAEARRQAESGQVACVFTQSGFQPALIRTVIEGTGARSAALDPLGAGLETGESLYFQLMRNLSDTLAACLRPGAG